MRAIRVFAHVSLDGVIAPGGPDEDSDYAHGGWTAPYRTPAGAAAVAGWYGTGFDLLLGRRTYDLWAGYWPKMPTSPIADGINAAIMYVATHRPEGLGWGPAVPLGDVAGEIQRLRDGDGPDLIACGGTTVTAVLFEHGLADEVVCASTWSCSAGASGSSPTASPRAVLPSSTRRRRRRACS